MRVGAMPGGYSNRTLRQYEGAVAERDRHAAKMRERNQRNISARKRATAMWAAKSTEERKQIMAAVRNAGREQ